MKKQIILKMLKLKETYGEGLFLEYKRCLAFIKDYFPYAKHEHYLLTISLPLQMYPILKKQNASDSIIVRYEAIKNLQKNLIPRQWAEEAIDFWIQLVKLDEGEEVMIGENTGDIDRCLDTNVQVILHKAHCYYNGEGIKEDRALALRWYEKAALLGSVEAMNYVGNIYYMGDGVPKNDEMALKWYEKAASLGNSVAMNYLGNMYYEGRGVKSSLEKARYWYNQAIAKANYTAMFNLGYIYCEEHLKQENIDFEKELRSALAGNKDAMYHVAYSYHWGEGIYQNYKEAKRWYECLATQGEQAAMIWLAYMYLNGQGVERSTSEAKSWCEKAIKKC